MVEIQRLYVFLALFTFVYFLESIGGTYMITAVQNIERHFQIPSKLSGFLVSAHDISYVLLVIQVAFYGSKGNRAKWIGFGTIMMALAHIMTSSPNFFFPPIQPQLNLTDVEVQLRPNPELLALSAQNSSTPSIKQLRQFLAYPPLRDRLPIHIRETLEAVLNKSSLKHALFQAAVWPNQGNYTAKNEYSLDEPLISEILSCSDQFLSATESSEARENAKVALIAAMRRFVKNREEFPEADLKTMRRAAVAPFAFCHGLVNQLRGLLQDIKCHRSSSNLEPLIIIFGAMLVLGFGRTMPWSLGIPLIDDNVKRQEMPIYFAMINFFKILGPICGFVIGSFMNKLYYTFPGKAPKGLTYLDPTWIGAWWLGFLIIGIVMIGPSVALFFFPESSKKKRLQNSQPPQHQHLNGGGLHGHRQHQIVNGNCRVADFDSFPRSQPQQQIANGNGKKQKERKKLALFDRHVEKGENGKTSFKAFLASYRDVLNSKVYVGASIARILDVLAFKGYMVFLPKYLEHHYGIPQYRVHIFMAFFGVLGFACGALSGGIIMRKLRLNGRKAAIYVLAISVFNTGLFALKSTLGCHSIVSRVGQTGLSSEFNFTRQCNAECGCESAKLYPVCDASGNAFYSPCHAGCRHVIDMSSYQLEFTECECVADGGMVSKELCTDNCDYMKYAFFATIVCGAFVAGTAMVPGMLLLLRSVPPQTRSPALGLQGLLVSLIGTLPSPILWGWLIDSACQVWDNDCRGQGACQIYDPWALRMRMHWLYVAVRLLSLVADVYVCLHAKGLNLQEEEETVTMEEVDKATTQETITLRAIPT